MSIVEFVYIRDVTVQKVTIESVYKHFISNHISVHALPGQPYFKEGLFRKKKLIAKETIYKVGIGIAELLSRQQVIDEFGIDPENLDNDLKYDVTVYYNSHHTRRTFDDIKDGMKWINEVCPDFKDFKEV